MHRRINRIYLTRHHLQFGRKYFSGSLDVEHQETLSVMQFIATNPQIVFVSEVPGDGALIHGNVSDGS